MKKKFILSFPLMASTLIASALAASLALATPQAVVFKQTFFEKSQSTHSAIVKEATDILSEHFGAPIQAHSVVQLSEPERRNLLLRIYLQDPHAEVPISVILKQTLSQTDSTQEDNKILGRFARDWAGLEFLSGLALESPITPQFYGGSAHYRFILIEDLGEIHVSLANSLIGKNRDLAEKALLRFMKCLGQLHAFGYGKTEDYFNILKRIHPQVESQEAQYHIALDETLPKLASAVTQLDFALTEGIQSEINEVFKANFTPGPFTTLIHGDICPDNLFDYQETNTLRLIDFEWGFVKNALLDGTYLRMSFPTCWSDWCTKRIPEAMLPSLEEAYRQELIKSIPAAANDIEYHKAYVHACALWMLKSILFMEDALNASNDSPDAKILRPRALSRLHAFIHIARQHKQLPHLVSMAEQILNELHARWPDTRPLDVYSAFESSQKDL